MNGDNPQIERWRERLWRGPLNATERAALERFLREQPGAGAFLEPDLQLSQALNRLPEAPAVSSNFTARVLQQANAAREKEERRRQPSLFEGFRRWLPRLAFAAVLGTAGWFSVHQLQENRRAELLQSVAAVSEVSSLPSPHILQDFDVIMALSQTPPADEQLLTLME